MRYINLRFIYLLTSALSGLQYVVCSADQLVMILLKIA